MSVNMWNCEEETEKRFRELKINMNDTNAKLSDHALRILSEFGICLPQDIHYMQEDLSHCKAQGLQSSFAHFPWIDWMELVKCGYVDINQTNPIE